MKFATLKHGEYGTLRILEICDELFYHKMDIQQLFYNKRVWNTRADRLIKNNIAFIAPDLKGKMQEMIYTKQEDVERVLRNSKKPEKQEIYDWIMQIKNIEENNILYFSPDTEKRLEGLDESYVKMLRELRKARINKSMTQLDLAFAIGVDVHTIKKFEAGLTITRADNILRICKALDVTLEEIGRRARI